MSPWIPRVLLALALIGLGYAIVSISVGEGGPGAPEDVGGINEVQRLLGGIPQDGAELGSEDAELTISVFNDVQCAPCADFQIDTVDPLIEQYVRPGEALIEFRHFSLAPNDTTLAAIAAEAAGEQARQWQYIDTFMRNQELADERGVTEELLREVAEAVPQLELEQWDEDFADPATAELVRDDAILADELKLPAQPAVVVSGPGGQRELIETPSLEQIETALSQLS